MQNILKMCKLQQNVENNLMMFPEAALKSIVGTYFNKAAW